ncbi:MAG: protein-export chaperone SecB, partial [Rickettsiales bacterium]
MADAKQDDKTPRFHVTGQYVKDLSFENPGAPASLVGKAEKPSIDVNIDLNAKKVQQDLYEVVLKVVAKASSGDKSL